MWIENMVLKLLKKPVLGKKWHPDGYGKINRLWKFLV